MIITTLVALLRMSLSHLHSSRAASLALAPEGAVSGVLSLRTWWRYLQSLCLTVAPHGRRAQFIPARTGHLRQGWAPGRHSSLWRESSMLARMGMILTSLLGQSILKGTGYKPWAWNSNLDIPSLWGRIFCLQMAIAMGLRILPNTLHCSWPICSAYKRPLSFALLLSLIRNILSLNRVLFINQVSVCKNVFKRGQKTGAWYGQCKMLLAKI